MLLWFIHRPVVSLFVRNVYLGLFVMNVVCNLEGFVRLDTIVLVDLPLHCLALEEHLVMWMASSTSALAWFALQGDIVLMKHWLNPLDNAEQDITVYKEPSTPTLWVSIALHHRYCAPHTSNDTQFHYVCNSERGLYCPFSGHKSIINTTFIRIEVAYGGLQMK